MRHSPGKLVVLANCGAEFALSPGYRWQPHNDGLWLFLGERHVAYITPLDNGRFRAAINLVQPGKRVEFYPRQGRAIA